MEKKNLFTSEEETGQAAGSAEEQKTEESASVMTTTCLNCGATLVGKFCHQCGQKASAKEPDYKFIHFLKSYVTRIYLWHPRIPQTLFVLLTRPGYLINEYIAGKHTTYTDPLVINRFFLLVITTLIGFFPVMENSNTSLEKLLESDVFITSSTLSTIEEDKEYLQLIAESTRDTVRLITSIPIIKEYPEIINPLSIQTEYNEEGGDTLIASVPSIFLQDSILVGNDAVGYHFSMNSSRVKEAVTSDQYIAVWKKMVDLTRRNIGLIILLICPIIALVIRILHFKAKREHMHYFIFSMYYSCVIEVVILLVFLLTQLTGLSTDVWEWPIMIFLWGYLIVALKKTFVQNSWFNSAVKALLINLSYMFVIAITLVIIFLIAIVWFLFEINQA